MTDTPTDGTESARLGEPNPTTPPTMDTPPMDTPPTGTPGADGTYGAPPYANQPNPDQPNPDQPYRGRSYPAPRLYRSVHDRKIGGVAGGLAEYFGLDPTLVRLITVFVAFGTGVGLLVYLAAWIIVPERPDGQPPARGVPPRVGTQTLSVVAGVGAIAVAATILGGSWFVAAFALIAGGVWLLTQQGLAPSGIPISTTVPSTYSAPPTQPQPRWGSDVEWSAPSTAQPGFESFAAPAPSPQGWPAPKPRKPQTVTRVVLSLLALLLATATASSLGGWWDPGPTRYLGLAIVIIGIGVVVGQMRGGGARGLIPLGLVAAFALIPVSAVDGVADRGIGDRNFRPTTVDDLQTEYEHGIGRLTVDLSNLELDDLDRKRIDIDLGVGRVDVIVPASLGGLATIEAGVGEISHDIDADRVDYDDGVGVDSGPITLRGEDAELELKIHVGIGSAALRVAEES